MTDENSGVVTTTRNPATAHNFGPASPRDEIVYTSERPGGDPQEESSHISMLSVQAWIDFMKQQKIRHVMVLLDDNELDIYEAPGLLAKYEQNGLTVHRNPMSVAGAAANAENILRQAEAASEKVVAHCTHGMGRSGRVAAGWLTMRYGLTPTEATGEALATARQHGMQRMGNVAALEKWLA